MDDNPDIASALVYALESADCETAVARDANAALRLATERRPHLIILDTSLPGGITGIDVLVGLRALPQTRQIPIIIFSEYSEPSLIEQVFELGASEFWEKSTLDPSLAADRLRRIVARGHVDRSAASGEQRQLP
ncbi:MAG: response regulator [Burkholderiales bacterium]|nr:response regulator [Phycisphaerae bacterium]